MKFTILAILIIGAIIIPQQMNNKSKLEVGDKIPSFTLKDQDNHDFNMDDYIGSGPMVIYFYPKDDTPGCTKEACSFRDNFSAFKNLNAKIIGISGDNVESHKAFAEKYNLPFTLLADVNNEVRKKFGVPNTVLGLIPGRVTYVVDNKGIVIHIYDKLRNAEKHIDEALKSLQ